MSLLLVVRHTTRTRIEILGKNGSKYTSLANGAVRIPGVLLVRIQEGLFFGNSGMLKVVCFLLRTDLVV